MDNMTPREAAWKAVLAAMPGTDQCVLDESDPKNPYCVPCQEIAKDYADVALAAYFHLARKQIEG